jgi:parallel beta-helix repeat protein
MVDNPAGSVVIEGLDINTPSGQPGIFYDGLSDDDANLGVVRNCTITGGQTGILARECDLKIRNNDISGFSGSPSSRGLLAIGLGSATRIEVTHNRIVGQPVAGNLGMTILAASIRVNSNDVRNTFSSAIQVFQTDGVIRFNQLTDNRVGINLIQSPNCLVEDNVVESTAVFTASINAQNLPVGHVRVADASNNAQIRNNTLIGGNLGISLLGSAGVVIDSNTVRDTVNAGSILGVGISVFSSSTGAEAHNNNIEGNASFGMLVDGTSGVVNATNNWWGAGDGPSGAGPGSGDAVTTNVNFSPFLTAPNLAAGA